MSATPVTPQPMIAATALEVPAGDSQAGHGDHRSDDIAAPVHDIEDGAFDGRRLLTLNGLAELGGSAEVLGPRSKRRHEIADEDQAKREFQRHVHPVDGVRPVKNDCGRRG